MGGERNALPASLAGSNERCSSDFHSDLLPGTTQSRVTDDFLLTITASAPEQDAARTESVLVLCEEAR
jgi:hypothetical protein